VAHQMRKPPKTYAQRRDAAFKSGLLAFKEGKAMSDCPINKHQGLRRGWLDGWLSGSAARTVSGPTGITASAANG